MLPVEIIRLEDAEKLPVFEQTIMQIDAEIHGMSRTQTMSLAQLGEAIQLGSLINEKTFGITWTSTDATGYEQNVIKRFFSSGDPYVITAEAFGVKSFWATVSEIDPTWKTFTITFTARWGGNILENTMVLQEESTAGSNYYWFGYYEPEWAPDQPTQEAAIQITLSAFREEEYPDDWPKSVIWNPGTTIRLRNMETFQQVIYRIGAPDNFGRWEQIQKRNSIVFDSTRPILGAGYFTAATEFFMAVAVNGYVPLELSIEGDPVPNSPGANLKIEAISRSLDSSLLPSAGSEEE